MTSTFVNDLRLNEQQTGDNSGSWGTVTNLNLELIGEALGFGTQQVFGSDANATTTVADGAADPARAMYFKVTSSGNLTATRTMTVAPNTVSRLMFIENATSGSQSIIVSQGSGANVTIPTGITKVVYLDGAGSGAAVVDAFAALSVVDLIVSDDLVVGDDLGVTGLVTIGETLAVTGVVTANAGVVVDEMTLDGDTLTATDTFTIDAVDDITLNCDNAGRILFGDASVIYGIASNSSSDFVLEVGTNDKDMLFKGSDNGSAVTALSLDMSAAGAATFNSHVTIGGETRTTLINTASSTGTLIMFGGASNKGGTIELSGGNNTGTTGAGIVFKTGASTANPATRMAIDLNGNVGIGIATPIDNSNVNLQIHDATSSGSSEIRLTNGSSGATASDGFQIQFDGAADVYLNNREAGPIIFKTSDTERMQITSGGILKIVDTELSEVSDNFSINIQSGNNDFLVKSGGTTFASFKGQDGSKNFGTFSNGSGGFNLFVGALNTGSFALRLDGVGTSASNVVQFANGNGQVGTITVSGTATAYNTSSDYRLKENVVYDWDATTRLKQLKPARFNFIADADTTVDGFLAHEAQAVIPESVTGTKDAMRDEEYVVTAAVEEVTDADGNVTTEAADAVMRTRSVPDIQSIDQSKLVPLLVKTILELEARITALES